MPRTAFGCFHAVLQALCILQEGKQPFHGRVEPAGSLQLLQGLSATRWGQTSRAQKGYPQSCNRAGRLLWVKLPLATQP